MRSGTLEHKVNIYKLQLTETDFGHTKREFVPYVTTRAAVERKDGGKIVVNDEIVFDYTRTFYLRGYVNVEEGWRIKHEGKTYEIQSIVKDSMLNQIKLGTKLVNE